MNRPINRPKIDNNPLPLSYTRDVSSALCCVCLDAESVEGCNIAVHQFCYGIKHVPEGDWFCKVCTARRQGIPVARQPSCILCPYAGGAVAPVRDTTEWAHVFCTWWDPDYYMEDPVLMEPVAMAKAVSPYRRSLRCFLCKDEKGLCIQCSYKGCRRAFHAICAQRNDLEIEFEYDENKSILNKEAFCAQHTKKVREKRKATVDLTAS